MNNLIQISNGTIGSAEVQTVNARDLHGFLESKQEFSNWIKSRIEQYGFIEGQDFTIDKIVIRNNAQKDYHISLDMAKELAMVERNEKGKQARQYFIECERVAKEKPALNPANFSRLQLIELAMQAEQERIVLEHKVEKMQPDVDAFNRIAGAEGTLCITNAAKDLQIQPKKLFSHLSANRRIYKRTGSAQWTAYQDKIQSGLLEHKVSVLQRPGFPDKVCENVVVLPKGLAKLAKDFVVPLAAWEGEVA